MKTMLGIVTNTLFVGVIDELIVVSSNIISHFIDQICMNEDHTVYCLFAK